MDATVKKIISDIRARKYAPVYFLQGEETFYIDQIAELIETTVLTEAEKGFNQVIVYGKDAAMATILTHARRYPMMSEKQVVIVKEAQDIPDLNKEIGAKLLLDYLSKPVPSTVLVFCHKHKSLDKRRELGKKIDQLSVCLTTKKLYDSQLPAFAAEYAGEKNVNIEDRAIAVLCELTGNDLHRLANEMDKLSISSEEGKAITAEKVLAHVGISKEYNIFELQRAIIQRDVLLANRIVRYFGDNTKKNPAIPVVAFLFSFFSKLLAASQVPEKNDKALVSALKISPYAAKDYLMGLRNYSADKIVLVISFLKEADLRLKGVNTGSDSEEEILRELVYRILH